MIDKEDRLSHLMCNKLQNMHHQFELRLTGLEALSPLKKLQSGFSYVSGIKDGISKNIRSVKDVCVEDAIKIYVTDGSLQAKVTGIESEN